nr:hypothetical protein [Candidatus Cloacimonadota bacterium]
MNNNWFKIKQIVSLVIFIAVLSAMGMITGRPVMMLAYAGFFLVLSVVIYFTLRRNQRHFEVVSQSRKTVKMIVAAILMILAIILPLLIALNSSIIKLPETMTVGSVVGLMLAVTIVFIALILLTLYMINSKGYNLRNRIIGYLSFIIAAVIPGALMQSVDRTTMGIGSVYYVATAVLILVYNARSLFCNPE